MRELTLHRLPEPEKKALWAPAARRPLVPQTGAAWQLGESPLVALQTVEGWLLVMRAGLGINEGNEWLTQTDLAGEVFATRRELVRTVTAAAAHQPLPTPAAAPRLRRLNSWRYESLDGRWKIMRMTATGGWHASLRLGPRGQYSISHQCATLREAALVTSNV